LWAVLGSDVLAHGAKDSVNADAEVERSIRGPMDPDQIPVLVEHGLPLLSGAVGVV
jgi:hypothetical protein